MSAKTSHIIILSIFLALAILIELIGIVQANPYGELGSVPPDINTKPPAIMVFSPQNGSVYDETLATLSINVSLPQSSTAIGTILYNVCYKGDWQENKTYLYINMGYDNSIESQIPGDKHKYFAGDFNLTDVPDGNHSITITAVAGGFYDAHAADYPSFYRFMINGSATIFFTSHNSPVSSISSSPTSSVPELPWLTILPLFLSILTCVVLISKERLSDSYD